VIPQVTMTAKTFADLAAWRKISVTGPDAIVWLNELVTADVTSLRPGSSQRCLLLDDAGGLRADFTAAVPGASLVLVQDPAQPRNIMDLLSFYTEGSDVELEDRSDGLSILAFPTRPAAPDLGGTAFYSPSALGPGADITCLPEDHPRLSTSLAKTFTLASPDDLEAWRIAAGRARMGVDAFEGDLPAEAGLMAAVALDKPRFLGHDAILAITPETPLRRLVLAVSAAGPVSPGDRLLLNGESCGELTSVTATDDGVVGLARVWWDQRGGPFTTDEGVGVMVRDLEPAG
jgi:glycine cleavage system aminomethyltransferase T